MIKLSRKTYEGLKEHKKRLDWLVSNWEAISHFYSCKNTGLSHLRIWRVVEYSDTLYEYSANTPYEVIDKAMKDG